MGMLSPCSVQLSPGGAHFPRAQDFPALLEKQQPLQDASVKKKELPPNLRGLS